MTPSLGKLQLSTVPKANQYFISNNNIQLEYSSKTYTDGLLSSPLSSGGVRAKKGIFQGGIMSTPDRGVVSWDNVCNHKEEAKRGLSTCTQAKLNKDVKAVKLSNTATFYASKKKGGGMELPPIKEKTRNKGDFGKKGTFDKRRGK